MTLRRSFLALLLALPAFALAVPYAPGMQDSAIQAGRDYRELPTPLPTASAKGRIEVREFFFYGCSHCYNLEIPLKSWLKRKADDVEFVPTPATLNKNWEPLAHAYYVAEELKVLDKTHEPLYAALHAAKSAVKDWFVPQTMFADLGLKYVGPVDGHDVEALVQALSGARNFRGPVVVHCVTRKGNGFRAAEEHEEDRFHSVGKIDATTGAFIERFAA